jgi:hypothetical protein
MLPDTRGPAPGPLLGGFVCNEHLDHDDGPLVFRHTCNLGLEGIVSKHKDSRYLGAATCCSIAAQGRCRPQRNDERRTMRRCARYATEWSARITDISAPTFGRSGARTLTSVTSRYGPSGTVLQREIEHVMKERISGKEAVRVAEDMASRGPVRVVAKDRLLPCRLPAPNEAEGQPRAVQADLWGKGIER